jgi:hypothetical protein
MSKARPTVGRCQGLGLNISSLGCVFVSVFSNSRQSRTLLRAEFLTPFFHEQPANYAHLGPSHLKTALEGVAGFWKTPAAVRGNEVPMGETKPVSNGAVTGTGIAVSVGQESTVQVREIYGAGDPD